MDSPLNGTVETERRDGVVILHLLGEHDLASVAALQEEIDGSEAAEGIVVSVANTQFIDSSTVHALFRADERLRSEGKRLVLHVATEPIVERVLDLSGLTRALPCAESLAEAVSQARSGEGTP